MIKIFTENLPYKLNEQITIEYNSRINEVNYFLSGNYNYYADLKEDIETIKLLLALSIFYKRVLLNFHSATKFTSRVILKGKANSVQLGTYELSHKEAFKLNKMVKTFEVLMRNYSIPPKLFEYLETKEFLKKIKQFKEIVKSNQ